MKNMLLTILLMLTLIVDSAGQSRPTIIQGKVVNALQKSIIIDDSVIALSATGEFRYEVHAIKPIYKKIK